MLTNHSLVRIPSPAMAPQAPAAKRPFFAAAYLRASSLFAWSCLLVAGCSIEAGDAPPSAAGSQPSYFSGELGQGDVAVLMVVDRSGSMMDTWDGVPKWKVAYDAVDHALNGVETELSIGALLFPLPTDCSVLPLNDPDQIKFQRADAFRERWSASLVSRPAGATPLGEAFRKAHAAVLQAQEAGLLERRFRVVVVTDGEPTCDEDPEEVVAYADQWREMGVEVRVMGLPGSARAAALLNRIAGVDVFEDPTTGETVVPDAGSSWEEGDSGSSYVAPVRGDEVDDSFYHVVR